MNLTRLIRLLCAVTTLAFCAVVEPVVAAEPIDYATRVEPIVRKYCFECHGDGADEGDLALDQLTKTLRPADDHDRWESVWKNLRAQTMPPAEAEQPSDAERALLVHWIEQRVFLLDPDKPDPGRVTVRRLNRIEYANTVRDLLGVQFNAFDAFPADDTGYGFDVIGDVLNISPLLMEKYVEAAQAIVAKALPGEVDLTPQIVIYGDSLRDPKDSKRRAKSMPFAEPVTVSRTESVEHPGPYEAVVEMEVTGSDEATSHTANLALKIDGKPLGEKELGWDTREVIRLRGETTLAKGEHAVALQLAPESPPEKGEKKLTLVVKRVVLRGPLDGSYREYPAQYKKIFFDGPPPADGAAREAYLRKILGHFATRAFRRPVDAETLDRLTALAQTAERKPKGSFERGVALGSTVILSSPRFLFRVEQEAPTSGDDRPGLHDNAVPIDEYSLASRLSYLLWSTMPDDGLMQAAAEGRLRKELRAQVDRMLDDPRSNEFVRNFVGQWLQTRDVETLSLDARRLLGLKDSDEARKVFNTEFRRSARQETELLFAHLLEENRPLTELLTADYTFLNSKLAGFYGIDDVDGSQMRKVKLSKNDHRGGLLTQASFLIVTSNPTRTSPVKRGLFILENLLGTPAPPPPADVPPLEAVKDSKKKLTMREMMELHRREPLCNSCHSRMDPLGLSLEQYNGIGLYRDEEDGKEIETAGKLITGETFADVRELAHVIAEKRTGDFYRCTTEKLMTYALGRGVEYYDAPAIDKIVDDLKADGRMRTLIYGIVESAPFQLRRKDLK